ncbi:protein YchN [Longimycelium tulufanense]|uniref:Protein YchN n=1 Tax=Longimycelium tulufanense TaxID=907463 RepID=A0A8J3FYS1_9PSEU|nr:DsrE family protein [Longimycelium tulufanense]GGM74334.1 protein YchN [Longimycelium tulufanense]
MKFLFVLHDPPYGTERTYNGLRWATQMLTADAGHQVKMFLFGDAVVAARDGQSVPNGFYNIGRMTRSLLAKGATVGSCGACLDARGMSEENQLLAGVHRSSMAELAEWTAWADQTINV